MLFLSSDFFFKIISTSVSNSLDSDQARRFIGPDLGPVTTLVIKGLKCILRIDKFLQEQMKIGQVLIILNNIK